MLAIDRRTLLIGGGVGVGLVVVWALWPGGGGGDLPVREGEHIVGPFLKIGRDGRVTVAVPQTETGQGVWTALPQVAADELGAAWESVAVEPAPLLSAFANPLAKGEGWLDDFGFLRRHRLSSDGAMRITAGSTSVRAFEVPMRLAGAAARAMLIDAAADRWAVDARECETADGFVMHGGNRLPFGELAEEAASRSPPRHPPLRQPGATRLIGRSLQRLDGPGKTSGSLRFASDVRLPQMLFASARIAPPGGRLRTFSRDAIDGAPGVRHVAARNDWIAVVADSWLVADRAIKAADPTFEAPEFNGGARPLFEASLSSGAPQAIVSQGDFHKVAEGRRPVAATYFIAPSQHGWIEPISATARWTEGRAELWTGSQAPGFAAAGGHTVLPMPVGGPSGRALECPASPIALALAQTMRRPVQVTLPHHVAQNIGPVSPGALARLSAIPRQDGVPAAWQARIVTGNGLGATLRRLAGEKSASPLGPLALGGTVPPYAIDHLAIDAIGADLPFATGYMRGSPEREMTFFTESFVDELARRKGVEPLAFRMTMLGHDPRLARCLQSAAAMASWDGGGPGSSMGIAGCSAYGSSIGLVATASIDAEQRVAVHRLFAAVDCGPVVNRGLAEQQIEAGLMWALAQATMAAPEWVGGFARASPLELPTIAGTPVIEVQFLPSTAPIGGLSGLGTLPLAPAVANAIHAATGKRMRDLPFDPMAA